MSRKSINFDNEKIKKFNFYKNKKLFNIYDIDVNRTIICKKEPLNSKNGKNNSLKYFIGYNDGDDVIRPLCIKLQQMIGYVKCFDSNKKIFF